MRSYEEEVVFLYPVGYFRDGINTLEEIFLKGWKHPFQFFQPTCSFDTPRFWCLFYLDEWSGARANVDMSISKVLVYAQKRKFLRALNTHERQSVRIIISLNAT